SRTVCMPSDGLPADAEQSTTGEHAVGHEDLASAAHDDPAGLGQLALHQLSSITVARHLEEHGLRKDAAGREALLEGEPALPGDLVDVQRPVPRVERQI